MVLDLPGRTRASLISFREWAYGLAFGVEMPFHSLSSVCTVRTRDAPVEIQMTMMDPRVHKLPDPRFIYKCDRRRIRRVSLFGKGEVPAIPGLPREKKAEAA